MLDRLGGGRGNTEEEDQRGEGRGEMQTRSLNICREVYLSGFSVPPRGALLPCPFLSLLFPRDSCPCWHSGHFLSGGLPTLLSSRSPSEA